jgi:hypothetical protein
MEIPFIGDYSSNWRILNSLYSVLHDIGSGITLYIVTDGLHSVNASIDGGTPTNHMVGNPTPYSRELYNVVIYDVQGLHSDKAHSLHVVPVSGLFWFDYAIVNDTVLLSPNPTATNTAAAPRSSK